MGEKRDPNFYDTDHHFDLKNIFPGEKIWEPKYPFCGGNDVGSKRYAKKQMKLDFKLIKMNLGEDWDYCAGDVEGKWYYADGKREFEFWPN